MRYIITAPNYTNKSAGIKVLYELQKWLIRFGKDAMVLNFDAPFQIADDDIVVYPEIVSGNPLKAKRVVRYLLNHPGKLGGDKEYDKDEILVAYDWELGQYSNGVVLRTPCIEDFFTNRSCERTINCFFVGKGINTNHPITKECIEISYYWPSKRRELAELLNRSMTFYTYDDRTALTFEAALCGCDIKLIKDNSIIDYTVNLPTLDDFKKQLEQFIKLTWYPEIDLNKEASESINLDLSALITKEHLIKGLSLKNEQRYEEALEALSAAMKIGDMSALAHTGDCFANLGMFKEAQDAYTRALRHNSDDIQSIIGMGVVKLLTKEYEAATVAFSKALQGDPGNSKALAGMGIARRNQGRGEIAFGYLKKALDFDPENITALKELVLTAHELGRFAEADRHLENYLRYHPADLDMLFSQAGVLCRMDKPDEALQQLDTILVFDPEFEGAWEMRQMIGNELQTAV
jgi:tetratricopeptide (TPR) repeat protein